MSDATIVSHVASPEYRANVDAMTCAVEGCKRWRESEDTLMCSDHRKADADRANAMDPEKLEKYRMRGKYSEMPRTFRFMGSSYRDEHFPDGDRKFGILEGFRHFYVRQHEHERFNTKFCQAHEQADPRTWRDRGFKEREP